MSPLKKTQAAVWAMDVSEAGNDGMVCIILYSFVSMVSCSLQE